MDKTSRNRDISDSSHHIFPSSRGGTSSELNLITLRKNYHQALHTVFANMTIDEQIRHLVDISKTAITTETTKELLRLINSYDKKEWYKDEVVKN